MPIYPRGLLLISTHAPRAGSDPVIRAARMDYINFNPRSPCGERPSVVVQAGRSGTYFNPRSPCGERQDRHYLPLHVSRHISTHAPRAGSDR